MSVHAQACTRVRVCIHHGPVVQVSQQTGQFSEVPSYFTSLRRDLAAVLFFRLAGLLLSPLLTVGVQGQETHPTLSGFLTLVLGIELG